MSSTGFGPIYGIELIDALPLGNTGVLHAMPAANELRDKIAKIEDSHV